MYTLSKQQQFYLVLVLSVMVYTLSRSPEVVTKITTKIKELVVKKESTDVLVTQPVSQYRIDNLPIPASILVSPELKIPPNELQ